MKMKLKSWHLYVLATLCFLFAFTSLNMKYDRFYRVNGIDNDNRSFAWGGELPEICQKTIDAAVQKLNDWKSGQADA